jgi:hypothetical protein
MLPFRKFKREMSTASYPKAIGVPNRNYRNQKEPKKLVAIWTNTGQPSPTMRHIFCQVEEKQESPAETETRAVCGTFLAPSN